MEDKELNFQQFKRNLSENSLAKQYLSSRNLSNKVLDNDQIAFCPAYSRYSFPLLRGRLIVPIRNVYGETIALAGRQIPSIKETVMESLWDSFSYDPKSCQQKIDKWNKGKWINEPYIKSKNLYFLDKAKESIRKKNYAIVVEGYFDVLSFYDNGIENICALCGTAITEFQVALLSRFCDNIVVIMDSDGPGKIASDKVASKIKNVGLNAYQIFLPVNCDPDDFAQKYDLSFLDETVDSMIKNNKLQMTIRT